MKVSPLNPGKSIVEELQLEDRDDVSRLRHDPKDLKIGNTIVIDRLRLPEIPDNARLLFLDATADQLLIDHIFGETEFHQVDFHQKAIVTQVFDRTGSNLSWAEGEDKAEELLEILKANAALGDKILCVSHKELADWFREQPNIDNLEFAHFNSFRGIDKYKDCKSIFITGRNQPSQSAVDGIARAVWWNDETPLAHDEASYFGVAAGVDLPTSLRGYLMTDTDEQAGVRVRSFSDNRIELIHQQLREAETIQAIARLRLVHSDIEKHVYLLGNLPVEMPIDELVKWDDLMPNPAELGLLKTGSFPLTPLGMLKMRPDMFKDMNQAKNANKRWGLNTKESFLRPLPKLLRSNLVVLAFKTVENGKPKGRTNYHLFRFNINPKDVVKEDYVANAPFRDWLRYLSEGDPEVPESGWGPIKLEDHGWLRNPEDLNRVLEGLKRVED